MTTERAIEILDPTHREHYDSLEAANEACRMGVKALEKQKPSIEGDGYVDKGELIYDTWICPCCSQDYETDYEHYRYCPNCGQRIDWRE